MYIYTYHKPKFQISNSKCASWSNGLVVKALDSQSMDLVFKTTG